MKIIRLHQNSWEKNAIFKHVCEKYPPYTYGNTLTCSIYVENIVMTTLNFIKLYFIYIFI